MKKRLIALAAALLLLVGCGAESAPQDGLEMEEKGLTGTWEGTTEMSVLGEGVEEPTTVVGTIRFIFEKEENGVMEMDFGTEIPPISQNFTFTAEGNQLTLEMPDQTMVYTFTVKGDDLWLDGRADFDLVRVS